ncbi:UNVERIFIED_CONTAM: hypothetical protein FKN15_062172 [Acipenser sinensis]
MKQGKGCVAPQEVALHPVCDRLKTELLLHYKTPAGEAPGVHPEKQHWRSSCFITKRQLGRHQEFIQRNKPGGAPASLQNASWEGTRSSSRETTQEELLLRYKTPAGEALGVHPEKQPWRSSCFITKCQLGRHQEFIQRNNPGGAPASLQNASWGGTRSSSRETT